MSVIIIIIMQLYENKISFETFNFHEEKIDISNVHFSLEICSIQSRCYTWAVNI